MLTQNATVTTRRRTGGASKGPFPSWLGPRRMVAWLMLMFWFIVNQMASSSLWMTLSYILMLKIHGI